MGPPWSEYKSIQEALGKREDEIANARLIVLAVNNHDALVAALQGVQTLVERHVRAFGQEASALAFINDPDTPKAFTAMRQALADAEGGS